MLSKLMLGKLSIWKSLVLSTGLFCSLSPAQSVSYRPVAEEKLWERLGRIPLQNAERMARVRDMFVELGCPVALLPAKGSKLPNVECRIPGESTDEIVIGAHYDKVKPGEGAIDNWTGVTMLVQLYESYREQGPKHTLVFVAFTDEEVGLVGSRAYVKSRHKVDLDRVKAFVNLDSLAAGPLEVWKSHAAPNLLAMASNTAKAINLTLYGMDVDNVGDGDSHSFRDKKIPVIDFHSLDNDTFQLIHTKNDVLAAVSREHYRNSYRFLAVYLGVLDARLGGHSASSTRP
jgi:hypothetical protein